ncbi:MAG: YhbY family RNA-binding protein, partial [Oscillospiraceae bacterium]
MALTSKQRAYLRGQAQHLDTIFQIGKGGVSEETAVQVTNALIARELIKLRVLDTCPYSAKEAADILCKLTNCQSVQIIGSKFVLFLQKDKDSKY